jgi:hypothetical protein
LQTQAAGPRAIGVCRARGSARRVRVKKHARLRRTAGRVAGVLAVRIRRRARLRPIAQRCATPARALGADRTRVGTRRLAPWPIDARLIAAAQRNARWLHSIRPHRIDAHSLVVRVVGEVHARVEPGAVILRGARRPAPAVTLRATHLVLPGRAARPAACAKRQDSGTGGDQNRGAQVRAQCRKSRKHRRNRSTSGVPRLRRSRNPAPSRR